MQFALNGYVKRMREGRLIKNVFNGIVLSEEYQKIRRKKKNAREPMECLRGVEIKEYGRCRHRLHVKERANYICVYDSKSVYLDFIEAYLHFFLKKQQYNIFVEQTLIKK